MFFFKNERYAVFDFGTGSTGEYTVKPISLWNLPSRWSVDGEGTEAAHDEGAYAYTLLRKYIEAEAANEEETEAADEEVKEDSDSSSSSDSGNGVC